MICLAVSTEYRQLQTDISQYRLRYAYALHGNNLMIADILDLFTNLVRTVRPSRYDKYLCQRIFFYGIKISGGKKFVTGITHQPICI